MTKGNFIPETASVSYSIRFNKVLAVIPMMLDEPNSWHEMTIRPKSISTSAFKLVSGSNNTNYPKSRNNGCWIALGFNHQGGIKAQLHIYNETIVFPIAFKKVVNVSVTPVGRSGTNTYKSFVRVNELSAQNFMANSDDVTISKLYWIAYGI